MRFGFISSLLLLHSPRSFRVSTSKLSVMSMISEVQVKKLSEHAVIPTRGSVFAAGMFTVRFVPTKTAYFLSYSTHAQGLIFPVLMMWLFPKAERALSRPTLPSLSRKIPTRVLVRHRLANKLVKYVGI
jgi:hypothetical protein